MSSQDRPKGLARVLPIASWLPGYKRSWLRGDLIGGLTLRSHEVVAGCASCRDDAQLKAGLRRCSVLTTLVPPRRLRARSLRMTPLPTTL